MKDVTYDFLVHADAGKNVHHFFSKAKDPITPNTLAEYKGNDSVKCKLNIIIKFDKLSDGEECEEDYVSLSFKIYYQ